MKDMNHNELQDTLITAFKQHPVLGFIVSLAVAMTTTTTAGAIDPNPIHWQIPVWVMQVGQWIAWFFVYATGTITILNWLEKVFDFKLNLKQIFLKIFKLKKEK